jgi:hypothetical protein
LFGVQSRSGYPAIDSLEAPFRVGVLTLVGSVQQARGSRGDVASCFLYSHHGTLPVVSSAPPLLPLQANAVDRYIFFRYGKTIRRRSKFTDANKQ